MNRLGRRVSDLLNSTRGFIFPIIQRRESRVNESTEQRWEADSSVKNVFGIPEGIKELIGTEADA